MPPQEPTLYTCVCIMVAIMVGAGYLAFFFTLSHNFQSVKHVGPGGSIKRQDSFMKRQVRVVCGNGAEVW